jgi:K+-transporting ATPase ATPase B chain
MPSSRDIHLLDRRNAGQALRAALRGLDPRTLLDHPVIGVLEVAAAVATLLFAQGWIAGSDPLPAFTGLVALWLWLTVLLARFAEALAEARARARADRLRAIQHEVPAKLLVLPDDKASNWLYEVVSSRFLQPGQIVLVETGDTIPADGEVIEGVASVDESAVTGESAPVIRESGDRSAVNGLQRLVMLQAGLAHDLHRRTTPLSDRPAPLIPPTFVVEPDDRIRGHPVCQPGPCTAS